LADAGFEAAEFLRDVSAAGAQFLVRSSARRCPTPLAHLPDGSYLARLGYSVLPALMTGRVIPAAGTIALTDATASREQWRLITSLLDPARHPARELVALYHERWQAETTYYSIKATILDGRVLRSRTVTGIDQETYALLTVYQALIRAAADTVTASPGLDMDRISFTILLQTAADLVTTASGILPAAPAGLAGGIGRAALRACCPPGGSPASRHAPARIPPANTARTPGSTPQLPRPTPSTPTSHFSLTGLRPDGEPKRNGVDLAEQPGPRNPWS